MTLILCRHCGTQILKTDAGWVHAETAAASCGPVAQPATRKAPAKVVPMDFLMRDALMPVVPLNAQRTVSRSELLALHAHLTELLGLSERQERT